MVLDVPTLMLAGAFVGALCGAALLFVWWTSREAAAFWFAGAALAQAVGVALLAVGFVVDLIGLFLGGLTMILVAPILFWTGVRAFHARPVLLLPAAAGVVPWLVGVPVLGAWGAHWALPILNTLIAVFFNAASIVELSRGASTFRARVPLIALLAVNALVLLMVIPAAIGGSMQTLGPPPVASLFGLIHFETIIYLIGTTVAVVALIKEKDEARLILDARTDTLTGLSNRRALHELADRVFERCRREGRPVAVAVFDLDHFKRINDTYGHAFGDDVLRLFSAVVRDSLRPSDVIGRVGGEEFFAVLPDTNLAEARASADRVRQNFAAAAASVGGKDVRATVSAGVMASMGAVTPLADLFEMADAALYRAKIKGRDRVECGAENAGRSYPRLVRVA